MKQGLKGICAKLAILPVAGLLALLAASCGGAAASPAPEQTLPAASTPAFPLDEAHYSRHVNALESVNGVQSFSNVGAPGYSVHPTIATVAVLESSVAVPTAWAVYRFPLNNPADLESIRISLTQSGFNKYLALLADYNSQRWQVVKETFGTSQILPEDWAGMDPESPGHWCYIAIVVVDGQTINISGLEGTLSESSTDPIFDDFEDNDTLIDCYPIGVGTYFASTHDDYVPEMAFKGEGKDSWDFYCIDLAAGDHFTATMEYEFVNHFDQPNGPFNDLDVLMYEPGVLDDPLNTFSEAWSSIRIYFTNMELVHFVAPAGGTYRIGIRGDLGDEFVADSSAEYVLRTFISADTHTVSGLITQNELPVDKKFLVVLTPGNFSSPTSLEFDNPPDGQYSIMGVPDGTYTLSVHGSAAWNQHDYIYPNTKQVVVSGGNVNQSMSIDPYPGT